MKYTANENRYDLMTYRPAGKSGLKLPLISLGLWHNFGDSDNFENCREMLRYAFDQGITHFDLANNYGPPPGSAETNFGKIFKEDFKNHRDEMVISTKAGWEMWKGPYGNFGSRKYLIASLDQSLKRLGLDYVDIFYHHRPDPETPLEETMGALDHIVKSGRALYVGISSYNAKDTVRAAKILKELGTPCLIHQPPYNMFRRELEGDLQNAIADTGMGCIVFSPLAQGLLTNRYLNGIPKDSRVHKSPFLTENDVEKNLPRIKALNELAKTRNQSLTEMALAWNLRLKEVTSVLIGASRVSQIEEALCSLNNLEFTPEELSKIDSILQM